MMSNLLPKELLHFCRVIGIFPVERVTERVDGLKFSRITYLYSLIIVTVQASLCSYGLLWDLERFRNEYPIKIQTSTVIAVMFCDVFSLSAAAMVCVVSAGISCSRLVQLFMDLQRFDSILKDSLHLQQTSVKWWFLFSVPCLTFLLALEFITRSLVSSVSPVYLSVFSLHYTDLAVQLQYLSIVDGIRRRFCLINGRIKAEVTRHRFDSLAKLAVLPTVENTPVTNSGFQLSEPLGLHSLSDLHWLLCGAVHKANAVFNWPLLAHMCSLFLHIIIAPYFFFFSMNLYATGQLSRRHLAFLALQVVWVLTHSAKLILLVWPCSAVTQEANKTAPIVCKLLNWEMKPEMRKQLETFILQLLHQNAEFSAFGLFPLQCPVLTSIAGAVTTYLVILIQFQNADSVDEPSM